VRPLLGLKKREIARALREAGATWREDSSNAKGVHFRNRLRLEVIPRWVRAAGRDALAGAALAFDNGQYDNVPPDIRAWFKGVIAPNGVPCCDISDGHRTEYDFREGAYWVPIEGQWMQVPAHAIIRDRGNPVGEAVVWYVHHRGGIIISCFVPADAV